MTSPQRFIVRMVLFVLALAVMSLFLILPLQQAFEANVFLNGIILGVLILGIIYNFRQVMVLFPEVAWIELFRKNMPGLSLAKEPRLRDIRDRPHVRKVGVCPVVFCATHTAALPHQSEQTSDWTSHLAPARPSTVDRIP